jgi:arylsulfatase A-like enzyme
MRPGDRRLLKDLKQRGLLDETLIVWGGEFGRTPSVELPKQGSNAGKINGRDHNHYGFTVWLAGGGVRGGHVHGATDEFGFRAVEDRVHVHDLHATLLHLLGFDHLRLTYRYAGRDFRLTDVHGNVVHDVIAVRIRRGCGRRFRFARAIRSETERPSLERASGCH